MISCQAPPQDNEDGDSSSRLHHPQRTAFPPHHHDHHHILRDESVGGGRAAVCPPLSCANAWRGDSDECLLDSVEDNASTVNNNNAAASAAAAWYNGFSALHFAAACGNVSALNNMLSQPSSTTTSLVDVRDKHGDSPLMWAIRSGSYEAIELLVCSFRCDVNCLNYSGESPLSQSTLVGNEDFVTYLLEHGAIPNIKNVNGESPLHLACHMGHVPILSTLVAHGAHVSARDNEGDTPLHWAIRGGHQAVVRELVLSHGASLDVPNDDGESPLDLAACLGLSHHLSTWTAPRGRVASPSPATAASPPQEAAPQSNGCPTRLSAVVVPRRGSPARTPSPAAVHEKNVAGASPNERFGASPAGTSTTTSITTMMMAS